MFKLRMAQLDVARQMENISFIETFITFLADSGFNALLLYLEDRIRTASYQFPAANEAYSEDEIRHIVAFAAERGIEVIPCVATLGHAERFLRHPELAHLAEVQDGMVGRFGGTAKNSFCVTNQEFYSFIETYLTEVAALFPSNFFHIGLDEFWDYNLCPRCKARMTDSAAEAQVFLEFIKRIHGHLAQLGKRAMMWSDMFEIYPDIFDQVPADIVMVDWQYHRDVRKYQGHLLNIGNEDRIAVSTACGHETVVAGADWSLNNPLSYFEYAKGREGVIGGLVTSWEREDSYLFRTMPIFAAAGHFMTTGCRDTALDKMMLQLFGTNDVVLTAAIRSALEIKLVFRLGSVSEGKLCTRGYFGLPAEEFAVTRSCRDILETCCDKVTKDLGKKCLDDLICALNARVVDDELQRLVHEILDGGFTPERKEAFEALKRKFAEVVDALEGRWNDCRAGITPNAIAQKRVAAERQLETLERRLSTNAWLRIACCLPDGYGVEKVTVEYMTDDKWLTAASGVFKPNDSATALYSRFIPLENPPANDVTKIRITAAGLGGIGVTFAEVHCNGKCYVPKEVENTNGNVADPNYLLDDDAKFSWFGGQDTRYDFFNPIAAATQHSCTLTLTPQTNSNITLPPSCNQ